MKLDTITTRNFEADAKLKEYVRDKLEALDRYVPRHARDAVQVEAILEEDSNGREDNRFVCEVIITLPGAKLVAREGTINMYAAVDIVEAKLKAQVRTYKEKAIAKHRRPHLLTRWFRRRGQAGSEPTV